MSKLKFAGLMAALFLSAMVATLNMTVLLPTNPDYEASWSKVCFSTVFAALWAAIAWDVCSKKEKP